MKFCSLPFSFLEIHSGGRAYLCCPRYTNNKSIGNILKSDFDAVWNSAQAQAIRAGIHDGSFGSCDEHQCPFIASHSLPSIKSFDSDSTLASYISTKATKLREGPREVKVAYDRSCNLQCPSCRPTIRQASRSEHGMLNNLTERTLEILASAARLTLSGDGDPFASHHYRRLLKLTAERFPELRLSLHTNGTLLNNRTWDTYALEGRVDDVIVSVDAATEQTYKQVRKGGRWSQVLRSLELLANKRRSLRIKEVRLAFVVQQKNYREMTMFVDFAKSFGFDSVTFSAIRNWGSMPPDAFSEAAIWLETHPMFYDFLDVLRSTKLTDPIVQLGDLSPLLDRLRK